MAALKNNGIELFRKETSHYVEVVMSNGWVLRNGGSGWKRHAKLKSDILPEEAAKRRKEKLTEFSQKHPAVVAYNAYMVRTFPLAIRWQVAMAVELMPDDPDGVWSEMDNHYRPIDLDDAVKACDLYRAAMAEIDLLKAV